MKTLVVYDSLYGNTKQIAQAIGAASAGDVVHAGETKPTDVLGLDLLIIGSPTQGGRPTPLIKEFIGRIPEATVKGTGMAVFDTRLSTKWVGLFGYAAGRIAGTLGAREATLVAPPEGFFVKGKEGPLKDGELERAAAWVRGLGGVRR